MFVYVVVLNLAIQYLPAVIGESFTLSLLTAGLLTFWLGYAGATTRLAKTTSALMLWVVAAGS